ncbi:MAG: hypothetical protein GX307_00100 [Euryarchaeota archaeon]|nr:hypothetical protein [Euryarchaeota archaeon]
MSELSAIRIALDELRKTEHVLDAALVSRGGMFIMGGTPKEVHRETFAAMSAIIFGAAETTSSELREHLVKVRVELAEQIVFLIGVGPKHLIAIITDLEADEEMIVQKSKGLIPKVELML